MRKQAVISVLIFLCSSPLFAAVPKKFSAFPEGERLLYSRIVDAYRRNQLPQLKSQTDLLQKNYPSSIHLDNAYYLSGMLLFQNAMYGEAVRDFAVVKDRYPKSSKRPGAMFAMAITYDRLGLGALSKKILQDLIKEYPGSQESQRAWMHLRTAKASPQKR